MTPLVQVHGAPEVHRAGGQSEHERTSRMLTARREKRRKQGRQRDPGKKRPAVAGETEGEQSAGREREDQRRRNRGTRSLGCSARRRYRVIHGLYFPSFFTRAAVFSASCFVLKRPIWTLNIGEPVEPGASTYAW